MGRERRIASAKPAVELKFDPEIAFNPEEAPKDWGALFGRGGALAVEIGSGNGAYVAGAARARPETRWLAIERSKEFYAKLKGRIAREELANARCVCADANDVLARAFAPGEIDEIVCNFSDPWPKRRHRDRRVFREEFLPLLERVLRPGGMVSFKSDVGWYFNLAVALFRRRAGWRIVAAGPEDAEPESEIAAVTNYQRRARESGIRVWGFRAKWEGAPG